jgi:hypothetical protein
MNESETRAEPIDPMLRNCGCGIMQDSGVARAFGITAGSIQAASRYRCEMNGYLLVHKDANWVRHTKTGVCRTNEVEKEYIADGV